MSDEKNPLQLDEVVTFTLAAQDQACALIHLPSRHQVELFDFAGDWTVRHVANGTLPDEILRRAPSLGLELHRKEMTMRFGPKSGQTLTLSELTGSYPDLPAAAAAALRLVRLLAGGDPSEWIWVAASEPDQRPDSPPARPIPWPPSAGT